MRYHILQMYTAGDRLSASRIFRVLAATLVAHHQHKLNTEETHCYKCFEFKTAIMTNASLSSLKRASHSMTSHSALHTSVLVCKPECVS